MQTAQPPFGQVFAAQLAEDARADGGRRMILLGPRYVTIKRRLQGVKMHLRVPVQNYLGVVLSCEKRGDRAFFRVHLSHCDPELCVTLRESSDQSDSIEAWHHWAAFFTMPALVESGRRRWEVLTFCPRAPAGSMRALPPVRRPGRTRRRTLLQNRGRCRR